MKQNGCLVVVFVAGFLILASCLSSFAGMASNIPKETLNDVGQTLAKQFTYEPFEPPLKDHIWMDAGNGLLFFLHFDRPVSEKGAKLIFIGDGIKGKFCAADQPDGGKTGFVHFHSMKVSSEADHMHMHMGGHGGEPGAEGYWLRHIAVGSFEMMGMRFKPGLANFMPTDPPHCK